MHELCPKLGACDWSSHTNSLRIEGNQCIIPYIIYFNKKQFSLLKQPNAECYNSSSENTCEHMKVKGRLNCTFTYICTKKTHQSMLVLGGGRSFESLNFKIQFVGNYRLCVTDHGKAAQTADARLHSRIFLFSLFYWWIITELVLPTTSNCKAVFCRTVRLVKYHFPLFFPSGGTVTRQTNQNLASQPLTFFISI